MPILTTHAIVLRAVNYRESDRILTLLSPECGRLTASARGSRKSTSRLLCASQVFCCGEYTLREIKGHYQVGECAVEDTFFGLSADIDALAHAAFLVSAAEAVAQEGEEQRALYVLLRACLAYLCYGKYPPREITTVFLFKLLQNMGYQPKVDACVYCAAAEGLAYFDAHEGGAVCPRCTPRSDALLPLSGGALYALRYHLRHDNFEDLLTLRLSPSVSREVEGMLQAFLTARLERPFRSAQFLHRLQELYRENPC